MNVASVWVARFFPKKGFVWNAALLGGATGISQGLFILASPVLTRMYMPEDFGVLAVFTAMHGILVVVSCLGYQEAITLPDDSTSAANLLGLCFTILALMSGVTTLLVFVLTDQIVEWTETAALRPYLWLLPVALLFTSSLAILSNWAVRGKEFASLACAKLGRAVGMLVVQLSFGILQFNAVGLLLGQVSGPATGSSTLALRTWRNYKEPLQEISLSGMRSVAKRYLRFLVYSNPAALLTTAWLQIPSLLLASTYGPEVAGWFALALLVLGAPTMVVAESVSNVYFGEAARLVHDAPNSLYRLFLATASRMFLLALLPMTVIAVGGSDIFELVFGSSWGESGLYAQLLAAMFIARFTVIPVQATLIVLERQDLFLALSASRFGVILTVFLISGWLQINPEITIALYSAAMSLIYLCHFFLMFFALRKHIVKRY